MTPDITETIGNVGGRTTAQGFNSADEVRKKYTGYERDDETKERSDEAGLDFAQARYYNSNHGRFTSVDPLTASATIRNPQTFNRYSYVLNSPYKYTDPLGLIASEPKKYKNGGKVDLSSMGGNYLETSTELSYQLRKQQPELPPPPPPPLKVKNATERTREENIRQLFHHLRKFGF